MKRQTKTQSCPACGSVMVYEKRDDVLEYKGYERTIKTLGFWCTHCGEGIVTGKPLIASENAFLALKTEVDKLQGPAVLAPEEVAMVRKKLHLSQRRASEVLGGGPRAFHKYETGKVAVSVPMSNLLRLLDNDPKRLEELTTATTTRASRPGVRKVERSNERSATQTRPEWSRWQASVNAPGPRARSSRRDTRQS